MKDILSIKHIIIGLVFIISFVGIFISKNPEKGAYAAKIEIKGSLDEAISLSMLYIKDNTLPTGRFVYRRDTDPKKKYDNNEYNALRHAGTLYSMYLCELYLEDNSLKENRLLASKYFINRYVQKLPDKENLYAVISVPSEEGLKAPAAKLGGAGLALIGLSNLYPEGLIDLEMIRGLGDFIIFMQKPDGSFESKYNLDTKSMDKKFVSLYYPGEAALGLLYLYDVDSQKKWLDTSKRALIYLADKRRPGLDVSFDHWAMLATEKLLKTENNGLTKDEIAKLQYHCAQMANSVIPKQITDPIKPYYGGFRKNIRPCSVGTIMEGLVAIYNSIDDEKLKLKVMKSLYIGTEYLSRSQIKKGGVKGGLPTASNWKEEGAPKDASIIRIDNVQHVLSAWITYQQLFAVKN